MHYKRHFFIADQRFVQAPRILQYNWRSVLGGGGTTTATRKHQEVPTTDFKKTKLYKVPSCLIVNIIALHYSSLNKNRKIYRNIY